MDLTYIYSRDNIDIQTNGNISNEADGIIAAQKDINFKADTINSDGIIMSGLNYDWTLGTEGSTNLSTIHDLSSNGTITSAQDINIESQGSIINHGGIYAQGNNRVVAWNDIINTTPEGKSEEYPALISAGRSTTIQANNIVSDGLIAAGKNTSGKESGNNTFENDVDITIRNNAQLHGNIGSEYGSVKISADTVDLSKGKIVSKNYIDIKANGNINNDNGTIVANNGTVNGIKLSSDNGNISNINGTIVNQNNTANLFLYAKNGSIDNKEGNIAGDGKVLLNANIINNDKGNIVSVDQATLFFKEGLNNSGYIGSKKAIMIYGNGTINNSGKFISSDWITINGNPYLYNDGIIAAEKQILIYSPNVKDSKGMGAPHIFINGSDLMNPFHWVAVMDTMGIIHWELEVGSYIPAVGGFATLVDGALYAIEGNSEEAKAKLIELPIGLIGAKVEAKVIEKTGAKVEAKLLKGSSKASINLPESESKLKHIFRNAEGHLTDTPANRTLLQDTANPQNYLGKDKYGNDWFAVTREDGTQVWVQSRNGEIWDGGLNTQPRSWNDQTGLKNPHPKK